RRSPSRLDRTAIRPSRCWLRPAALRDRRRWPIASNRAAVPAANPLRSTVAACRQGSRQLGVPWPHLGRSPWSTLACLFNLCDRSTRVAGNKLLVSGIDEQVQVFQNDGAY